RDGNTLKKDVNVSSEKKKIALEVKLEPATDDALYEVRNLPEGASFDPEKGAFLWQPGPEQHGIFQPTFSAANADISITRDVRITIPNSKKNKPPVMLFTPDFEVDEGMELSFTVQAWDPNGDSLLYFADNLPLGASFDGVTGEFTWTPTRQQSGFYRNIHLAVSDGFRIHKDTVDIFVNDTNPEYDLSGESVEMYWKLRDPIFDQRLYSLGYLENFPVGIQILENIRLLRDPVPCVRKKALENLKHLFGATIQVDAVSGNDDLVPEELNTQYHSYLVHAFFAVKQILMWSLVDFEAAISHLDKVTQFMDINMKGDLDDQAKRELKILMQVIASMTAYNKWRGK
ncbi:Ig domain-containing protein, partial [Planctomycetota bacterium]